MEDLSPSATLDIWATAQGLGPVERAVRLAAAVDSDALDAEGLARLPLGSRNARLLDLYTALAGPALEATAGCPACGEPAEFAVDSGALLAQQRGAREPAPFEADELVVVWRSPDSADLTAAAQAANAADAERVLLERCVTEGPEGELPPAVRLELAEAMTAADPLAEVLVDVSCPDCGERFSADVDIAAFAWAELEAKARGLLHEVAVLARAFGWTEREVVALDETRRAAYLALVQEGSS